MKFKYTIEPGSVRSQWRVLENGELVAVCFNGTNAATMIDILNNHDALKAKAGMLDKVTKAYGPIRDHLGYYVNTFETQYPNAKSISSMWKSQGEIDALLAEIKVLK